VLDNLGNVALLRREYARVRGLLNEALALGREVGDTSLTASAILRLGTLALWQADHSTAGTLYQESLAMYHDLAHRPNIA